jgi:excisionase family DNA binding protein
METAPHPDEPAKVLLSVEAAARSMSVTSRHVWNLVARGEIRTVSLGRRRLIPVSELARIAAGVAR